MRATIQNYLAAAKARREETGEKGFSLIELIIVVVIIGILAAIALPVFGQIQKTAIDGATESATKNAATTAVADVAEDPSAAGVTKAQTDATAIATKTAAGKLVLTVAGTTPATICVTGHNPDGGTYITAATGFKSGPGC